MSTEVVKNSWKKRAKESVMISKGEDIRRELGMEIIEEHTVMEYSKVNKKCEKCGHGEAIYYTRHMRSVDKGKTTFYTCTGYGHPSQEN
ncbi:DNA-directed RNA polymerase I subunit RPA12 [Glycine soja]|uniref:DNA-directed RNA polymerase I subunit RPA12 n=1 Tax=Glycine soja TaxID=3848 RepID=A0A0B2QVB4_GLYSO|nr:DNA-directed RNA polymerase I subunit RPA12 [Glycine soja]